MGEKEALVKVKILVSSNQCSRKDDFVRVASSHPRGRGISEENQFKQEFSAMADNLSSRNYMSNSMRRWYSSAIDGKLSSEGYPQNDTHNPEVMCW